MSQYNPHSHGKLSRKLSENITDGLDEDDNRLQQYRPSKALQEKRSHVMEHLATFTVNRDAGIVHPMDGMRRLLQMEKNTGIWSQKMRLCLDNGHVLITDYETGDLIEKFPSYLVECPTAFTSDDVLELYNNVLVFIVSAASGAQSEMHIFQSQSMSAVDLVQEIKSLQSNDLQAKAPIMPSKYQAVSTHSSAKKNTNMEFYKHHSDDHRYHHSAEKGTTIHGEHNDYDHKEFAVNDPFGSRCGSPDVAGIEMSTSQGRRFFEDTCSVSSERYEREVCILNSCFDDIEKFIARLQHTAAAVREVERRRHKHREIGDGLINLHTRPPMEKEFVEILGKFKLSFNLLSKLKTHIHDPNAPELVHFLFTPLALIVEAARDTYSKSQLTSKVIEPLLTSDTINFLINCVSSKETELWKSLGPSWTVSSEQWHEKNEFHNTTGYIDKRFQDNADISNFDTVLTLSRPEDSTRDFEYLQDTQKTSSFRPNVSTNMNYLHNAAEATESAGFPMSSNKQYGYNTTQKYFEFETAGTDATEHEEPRPEKKNKGEGIRDMVDTPQLHYSNEKASYMLPEIDTMTDQWLNMLRKKGANTAMVCYPRMANNDKELSVSKGEYLEILDDSRKWWKARNMYGQIGHVPSTIVASVHGIHDNYSNQKPSN
uniref:SH3 domain-containing protein n=1 Tax=Stomoxys calcitrans TaxID=35570 RepID=A0A1I8Q566_STOCA